MCASADGGRGAIDAGRDFSPGGTLAFLLCTLLAFAGGSTHFARAAPQIEILEPVGGLPAHIVARFQEPLDFVRAPLSGQYVVLDRRAHTIYALDARKRGLRTVIEIGAEQGRVLQPAVLAMGDNDFIAVADAPGGHDRVQYFSLSGSFLGGFYLDRLAGSRMAIDGFVVNGVGSLQFTGRTFLINRPAQSALFSEHDYQGQILRHVGTLRPTGHEGDAQVHQALNSGFPLVDPTGGFYFVFRSGRPMFRRYAADGTLLYERHIEGAELDRSIARLPTTWRAREAESGHSPLVEPLVRAAAVDQSGRLWVSLAEPYTYVYDARGDKVRTIVFDAPGLGSPRSLFFTEDNTLLVAPGCYEFKVE